jgi:hypothetical protein
MHSRLLSRMVRNEDRESHVSVLRQCAKDAKCADTLDNKASKSKVATLIEAVLFVHCTHTFEGSVEQKSKTKQKPDSIRSESDRIGLVLPIGGGHIFSKSRSFNDRGPKNNKIDDVCCCVSWRGILLREANSVYNLI